MVDVVKWLRHRIVAPACMGSNPIIHPIFKHSIAQISIMTLGYSQAVRQWTLTPSFEGSNPSTLANFKSVPAYSAGISRHSRKNPVGNAALRNINKHAAT